jgi:hypothetical protein
LWSGLFVVPSFHRSIVLALLGTLRSERSVWSFSFLEEIIQHCIICGVSFSAGRTAWRKHSDYNRGDFSKAICTACMRLQSDRHEYTAAAPCQPIEVARAQAARFAHFDHATPLSCYPSAIYKPLDQLIREFRGRREVERTVDEYEPEIYIRREL